MISDLMKGTHMAEGRGPVMGQDEFLPTVSAKKGQHRTGVFKRWVITHKRPTKGNYCMWIITRIYVFFYIILKRCFKCMPVRLVCVFVIPMQYNNLMDNSVLKNNVEIF